MAQWLKIYTRRERQRLTKREREREGGRQRERDRQTADR